MYDVIIIGGGASGLAAGIVATDRNKRVLILEANDRIGKKILATGNGKCNLANMTVNSDNYNCGYVNMNLSQYDKIFSFFNMIGLKYKTIEDRIYPYSESANTVVNMLRRAYKGELVTDCEVTNISIRDGYYEVNGYKSKNVVLATGSNATFGINSHKLYENLGHKVTALRPSLVPLISDTTYIKNLAGVRAKARISLLDGNVSASNNVGEILFKENGLSGIASFMLSSYIARKRGDYSVSIDFCPDIEYDELEKFLLTNSIEGLLHKSICESINKQSKAFGKPLAFVIKNFAINQVTNGSIKNAQVVSGGLINDEFDSNFMSKIHKGLYACGEVMDIDGDCGGYNLSWAFLSGIKVGESIC